ncbi:tyrosine--tRNA ligase [Myxococcota bacterium]|nr:tyrosine--tRNA ligase [Myxococcota bacterium]
MNFIEELKERELFYASTDEEKLLEHLGDGTPVSFYIGFDPTADSLHVGSLLQILLMVRLQNHGHRPIAVVGGGTGMIGDPSGKSAERKLLDEESLKANVAGIEKQLAGFLRMGDGPTDAKVVNNYDWLSKMGYIEFLRDIGKFFSVNSMIAKESVKNRLSNREQGISYTEFSYMLLQSYDYLHLFRSEGCTLQMGGSDQWGNITTGIDLIRRMEGQGAHGITIPLLTTASGTKFGKTEAGTVWLDADRTSPYQFYQFWVRTEDADVIKLLKNFTFLPMEEISLLEKALIEQPGARIPAKKLAEELTRMVHGEEGLTAALNASKALFGGDLSSLSARELAECFEDVPSHSIELSALEAGIPLLTLLADSGFVASKGEARRLIKQGGFYVNNQQEQDQEMVLTPATLLAGRVMVFRAGKKRYMLIKTT